MMASNDGSGAAITTEMEGEWRRKSLRGAKMSQSKSPKLTTIPCPSAGRHYEQCDNETRRMAGSTKEGARRWQNQPANALPSSSRRRIRQAACFGRLCLLVPLLYCLALRGAGAAPSRSLQLDTCEPLYAYCEGRSTCFIPEYNELWGFNVDLLNVDLAVAPLTCPLVRHSDDCAIDLTKQVGTLQINAYSVHWNLWPSWGGYDFALYGGRCPVNDGGAHLLSADGQCSMVDMQINARTRSTYPLRRLGQVPLWSNFTWTSTNFPSDLNLDFWPPPPQYVPFPLGVGGLRYLIANVRVCRCSAFAEGCVPFPPPATIAPTGVEVTAAPSTTTPTAVTETPTAAQTAAPVSAAPTPATTTASPTPGVTTGAPISVPTTSAPTLGTVSPSASPSAAPATSPTTAPPTPDVTTPEPSPAPTPQPVPGATSPPTPTPVASPTPAPVPGATAVPTPSTTTVQITVPQVSIAFKNVGELSMEQINTFVETTESWFEQVYNRNPSVGGGGSDIHWVSQSSTDGVWSQTHSSSGGVAEGGSGRRNLRRSLQSNPLDMGILRMKTALSLVEQDPGDQTNTLTYDQTLEYRVAADNSGSPSTPVLLIQLPYLNDTTNAAYANALQQTIPDAFGEVGTPIAVPDVDKTTTAAPSPTPAPPPAAATGLSMGAIIGIAVGGGVFLLVLLLALCYSMQGRPKRAAGDMNGNSSPAAREHGSGDEPVQQISSPLTSSSGNGLLPTQLNPSSGEEDVSTMADTYQKITTDTGSLGGYGDQSIATVDYDYSKAYGGGGGDTSVISSSGGTMGDTTRGGSRGTLGLGNSGGSSRGDLESFKTNPRYPGESVSTSTIKEDMIEIKAPPGKLGVVIDTPDDGAPIVHAVKDTSVIAEWIRVGDKLIAVDDEDVRHLTAIKVSKLISKKSSNPMRKLTLIRTTLVEE